MKNIGITPDGTLTCPKCGATQFANKRTTGAKLVGGVTVGVGALAAPKRMQCLGCREYLKSPPVPIAGSASSFVPAAATPAGDVELTITGTTGTTLMIPTVLETLHPKRLSKEHKEAVKSAMKAKEPIVLDTVRAHEAPELVRKLEKAHYKISTRNLTPDAPAAEPTTSPQQPDVMDQLRKLGELRDAGILTPDEFDAKKTDLLDRL